MPDRTESRNWPSDRGPWPEVTTVQRVYDHGFSWCLERDGHPDPSGGGYPDAALHDTAECQSRPYLFDGLRVGLLGEPVSLAIYGAAPFQFGALRSGAFRPQARIMLDLADDAESSDQRLSLALGDALAVGRSILKLVDLVMGHGA
jgi:hypothetical protein